MVQEEEEIDLEIIVEAETDLAAAVEEAQEEVDLEETDSEVEIVEEETEAVEDSEKIISTVVQEKCTRQHALIVRRIVKFLSNQQKASQYTVETVSPITRSTNFFIESINKNGS